MAYQSLIGFSTLNSEKTRQRTFYNLELCRRDLTNHFHTRPGERVMRPLWGCGIWALLMEPMTPALKDLITEEAMAVIAADQRCEPIAIDVREYEHGIVIDITMNFVPENVIDTFTVDFNTRNTKFFS